MSPGLGVTWRHIGAFLVGGAALAAIHAAFVVPPILDAAEIRARRVAQEESKRVESRLDAHLKEVELIRSSLVSKSEFDQALKLLDRMDKQLDRIEERLNSPR